MMLLAPEIPSIWREEVWHALSVHLPIATLFLASLTAMVYGVCSSTHRLFLGKLVMVLLAIGVISGWAAIYTGEIAYSVEVRKICDPKVLQEHSWWAYATLFAYSGALGLIMVKLFSPNTLPKFIKFGVLILLIAALGGLIYTGHLGASLVYQQGAGTYKPSADCAEFVK